MYDDADSVLATIARQTAEAQERARDATRFRQEVERVRGTAQSPDRTVVATVDSAGLLVDLDIRDGAMNRRGGDLARLVRETVHAAQRDVAATVTGLAAQTFGPDSPSTARMRAELDERFVAPEPVGGSLVTGSLR